MMRIGLDLDNTLISYETAFSAVAKRMALLPIDFKGGKAAVRRYLRSLPGGEQQWRDLQAEVYGREMRFAELTRGAEQFLGLCRQRKVEVVIVSHKSEYAANDRHHINLRHAALAWLEQQGLFDTATTGLTISSLFFEGSRDDKVKRIARLAPDCFVDDLPEVLLHPAFPATVRPILYSPGEPPPLGIDMISNWEVLADELFVH
ncbi:MAG: hypothetical protein ABW148_06525 [Sedimenticola sp.]